MCLSDRAKLAAQHASYVAGLSFFSVLSTQFVDQILLHSEIYVCVISSFIVFGLSFFTSMNLQARNGIEGTRSFGKKKTTKRISFINNRFKRLFKKRHFTMKLFVVSHNPHGDWDKKC